MRCRVRYLYPCAATVMLAFLTYCMGYVYGVNTRFSLYSIKGKTCPLMFVHSKCFEKWWFSCWVTFYSYNICLNQWGLFVLSNFFKLNCLHLNHDFCLLWNLNRQNKWFLYQNNKVFSITLLGQQKCLVIEENNSVYCLWICLWKDTFVAKFVFRKPHKVSTGWQLWRRLLVGENLTQTHELTTQAGKWHAWLTLWTSKEWLQK